MIIPLGRQLLVASSELTRKPLERVALSVMVPLFALAPCRVWLFSLQRLPDKLPFPLVRSMPWTFSLFHCSSPRGGGPLALALPFGVRTFLYKLSPAAIIHLT